MIIELAANNGKETSYTYQKSSQTIADRMNAAQVAINNTLSDAEIQSLVVAYGYNEAKMNEGKQRYDQDFTAVNAQIAAAGAQRDATAATTIALTTAQQAYQSLNQVARAAFAKDKIRLAALGITGAMPLSTSGFITAAYVLFDNALKIEEIQKVLATYSIINFLLQKYKTYPFKGFKPLKGWGAGKDCCL